ncbi:MAG TPA: protein kinase [Candidatus Ozemobacteraceae bacterium]|nr:protein kinase [Candidatus Ozemobacteraceae bacterium]
MIRSVFCPKCRLRFEVIESPRLDSARCPHCAGQLDLGQHSHTVEKLGHYQIIEMIGQGGMGQVFKARNPDGKLVAVKLMSIDLMSSAELTERFEREMDILASLQHENIVQLLDRGVTSAYKYFVMELVEGVTLRSLINTGSLTEAKIASIAVESLKALGYAHAKGIIHRDIKPENILFDRHGKVKITDFGLARRLSTASGDSQGLTATNAFMGTENYMSPEQKINPKAVTHKSDIYSFGVLLYEMLTGGHLPMGLFQPPSSFKTLDDFWDRLCFRMLDINPDLRPENGVALAQEIEAYRSLSGINRRPFQRCQQANQPVGGETRAETRCRRSQRRHVCG